MYINQGRVVLLKNLLESANKTGCDPDDIYTRFMIFIYYTLAIESGVLYEVGRKTAIDFIFMHHSVIFCKTATIVVIMQLSVNDIPQAAYRNRVTYTRQMKHVIRDAN